MATSTERALNHQDGINIVEALNGICDAIGTTKPVRYGIKIDKNDSDPSTRITYMYDAVGMTPAAMGSSAFSYGSWENTPLMESNYPCMVKSDGTEDYKLDPDDLTLKADGTASDVADTTYDGNAMSAFVGGWLCQYEDDDYEYIIWSNVQYDSSYHCYHRMDSSGNVRPGFYWNIYPTSIVDSTARSISGQTPMASYTAANERTACQANGDEWDMVDWSEWNYIMALLSIIGCSDDLQTTFGQGVTSPGSSGVLTGGELNSAGAFWGDISGTVSAVKVFNIEHLWGNQYHRLLGMIAVDGELYISPYGPYDLTASDDSYVDMGVACATSGYVVQTSTTQYGRITETVGGSSSTYRCDYYYINTSGTRVAIVGGYASAGSGCGSYVNLRNTASSAYWYLAPGLTSKMLAA